MNEPNLFVLIALMEEALMEFWTFKAKDEVQVARYVLQHSWKYENLFFALRISWKEVDGLSPDTLLQAIEESYGDTRNSCSVYLLRIPPDQICNVEQAPDATLGDNSRQAPKHFAR
jgi:hypothetical protein